MANIIIAQARATKDTKRYLATVDSPNSAVVMFVNTIAEKNPPNPGQIQEVIEVAIADVESSTTFDTE